MAKLTHASKTNIQSTKAGVESHHSLDAPTTMVVLDKIEVDIETYELVEIEFTDILPYLRRDAFYTSMDLIGEPVWAELTTVAQRKPFFA